MEYYARTFQGATTISPQNDVWGMSTAIPYRWCVTTQFWIKSHFQLSFLRHHFGAKTSGASWYVYCFLRLHFPLIFTQSKWIKKLYFYLEFYGAFCWYNTMIMRAWKHCINISSSWWLKYLERCVNLLMTNNSFN